MDILDRIGTVRRQGVRAVLVTVIATRGSTPRKIGARMLLYEDGTFEGTIGGGAVEQAIRQNVQRVLRTETPEVVEHALTTELAMCCGGQMTFFLEPIVNHPTLIVMGCGHIGSAVLEMAASLGFNLVAVDEFEENLDAARFASARLIRYFERDALDALSFDDNTYVVIATREHKGDQALVEYCATKTTRYLGVIGSARKAELQRERMRHKGIAEDRIARVRCPIGLDIGAQTPAEIAVSIVAEITALRRGGPRFEKTS